MKKLLFFTLIMSLLGSCVRQPKGVVDDVLLAYTPVKDQDTSQVCWAYAMLSTIETEHIMRGDSVHLSVAFVERIMDEVPGVPPSKRGMGITAINVIQKFGVVPYNSMRTVEIPKPRMAFMYGATYTLQEFARSVLPC